MAEILYHFLQHLGWGMLCALPLVPGREIGRSFFVINVLAVLGLWIAALAIQAGGDLARLDLWTTAAAFALMISFAVDPQQAPRASLALLCVAIGLGAVAIVVSSRALAGELFHESQWFLMSSFAVSGWLAGATMVAMILGHYYLVTPTLSFGLLGRFTRLISVLLVLRVGLSIVPAFSGELFTRPSGAHAEIFFVDHLAFVLQRGLAIVFLAVLIPMVWDCVKRRSNQSATGLLYVMSFLALMGEGVATYFAVSYRLPI